ncbi:tRNA (adenosine(37)-N6)-threonylcarbamoyltransferase complex dimerization subunit type 1 TsaB [Caenimonas aquaedulcis]|uniref:tRNA (Adenosine(37)-N6)-threonylcarbamoyltransferase complex dimerization subunit type 1 TsaB n=1 Tax=Caenimonas aquaedulcis TaxID=2793270 RepID=A0A931MI36_9BURK|nr:tRNA (adenosine(37)-N6)-threonylcarbamoyltransferase complex dimerization subunit type 1 TsaB [Caenimonas aquaedulcis]MBG9388820.1 tRNA (adenosine(37)-N6)-threonylcarbamoyltransferase complex dimerization subunit type 1 TsaB [Caenimonas aquaedulcis]
MNLLAFDTSTDTMSIAVRGGAFAGGDAIEHVAPGGAQASAALIPAVMALLARAGLGLAQLDAISFGRGPGSFTGLRTACAVAQGLAFGADVPVLPLDTLMAVAEEARALTGATRVIAALDARMDQVYWAAYIHGEAGWGLEGDYRLTAPEDIPATQGWTLAGNAFHAYATRLPGLPRVDALPTARALLRIAPAALAAGLAVPADRAMPLYIRDKVAQTTQERAAARALASPTP